MLERDDDFDRRIRNWLQPDQHTVERLATRVLSAHPRTRRNGRLFALSAVAGLLMATAGVWLWHSTPADVDEYTASFDGDVLLIRAADGTTSILGPPGGDPPPAGTAQIVFEGEPR